MKIEIKNHDHEKRYKVKLSCGGVHKKVHIPVGMAMPLTWSRKADPSPLRPGEATGEVGVHGEEPHRFTFTVTATGYSYSDDHIAISGDWVNNG